MTSFADQILEIRIHPNFLQRDDIICGIADLLCNRIESSFTMFGNPLKSPFIRLIRDRSYQQFNERIDTSPWPSDDSIQLSRDFSILQTRWSIRVFNLPQQEKPNEDVQTPESHLQGPTNICTVELKFEWRPRVLRPPLKLIHGNKVYQLLNEPSTHEPSPVVQLILCLSSQMCFD